MSNIWKFILSLVVKKRKRVFGQEMLSRQAREQIKLLKSKGLRLPVVTL
ncbi:hypothetical protein HY030_00545 [Candidatus Gottesmanbacteria bacterium]|nr:hypothetical protein [Candidatus Gottesmanbacteria bacterium]